VIDGDTFYLQKQSIRIADIDAPETHPPRCAREAALGEAATRRLGALLNAGPFEMQAGARDEDRYGRKLRTLLRDGQSLGGILVTEGLARRWTGSRQPWCDT
jgi:endonuclease YncB( thermonuclease family)